MSNRRFFKNVLIAGIIVGTLDILAASIQFYINTGRDPMPVFKYIASAVFGPEASKGGSEMALIGLLFHYLIAIGFTLIFFILARKVAGFNKYPLLTGILYGIVIWTIMRFVVLPLSRVKVGPVDLKQALIASLILIVCIGIPLAYMAGNSTIKSNFKFSKRPE